MSKLYTVSLTADEWVRIKVALHRASQFWAQAVLWEEDAVGKKWAQTMVNEYDRLIRALEHVK